MLNFVCIRKCTLVHDGAEAIAVNDTISGLMMINLIIMNAAAPSVITPAY